uniref:protein-tyrosine-phosphatase n=1 Tax=Crassostrea virginica TaxID=6565 RepID=A0A8B8C8F7_CRAVI|nr:receptor-type tyrosine-protein phosphatase kappa-like [Crassostrea virginica]
MTDSESKTGLITGLTLGMLAVLFIIGSALVSFRLRQRRSKDSANPLSSSQFGNVNDIGINNEYANTSDQLQPRTSNRDEEEENEYYNTGETCTDIQVSELQWIIKEKSEGQLNVFQKEYKRLPAGNARRCKIGQLPENANKNRFKTTFPYDHSRVVLQEKWSDEDGDYINANYIRDFKEENHYLAAQGPKSKTLSDFWRLIWQENIECIVMLTNLIETGKNKCSKYWPDRDEPMTIGPCSISLVEEIKYAFFVVRKLSVQKVNTRNERHIVQLHYTSWPDHGTPEEMSFVQFHRAVEKRYKAGSPLLVHCSAGVGRTGTFIGYDALLKRGRETGRINVFEFVKQMREDRMSMVQTQEQYICLHKALACGFVGSERTIQLKDLDTKMKQILNDNSPKNQQSLNNEFKLVSTWNTEYKINSPEDRNNSETKHVAADKYRAYLTSYIKGRTDYIDAVIIPSYTYHKGFILTNTPLPDDEIDVWRLMVDHAVDAIVVFDSTEWIPQKGTTKTIPPYTITYRDVGCVNLEVTEGSIYLSVEGEKRDIEVYKIATGNQEHVVQGVKLLLEKSMRADVKTLLMSRDGTGPAGLFAIVHNALQQLRLDEEVDIFNTVMQIQSRRPDVIASLEEYRSCYQMVLDSRLEEVYANV